MSAPWLLGISGEVLCQTSTVLLSSAAILGHNGGSDDPFKPKSKKVFMDPLPFTAIRPLVTMSKMEASGRARTTR